MRMLFLAVAVAIASQACAQPGDGHCAQGATRNEEDRCRFPRDAEPDAEQADANHPDGEAGDGSGGDAARCEGASECTAQAPVCLGVECGPCRDASDCSSFADAPLCGQDGSCVACKGHRDCGDPVLAFCQDHQCVPCTSDEHCERASSAWMTPHCDVGEGACVECVPGIEGVAQCFALNGRACDPATSTCSGEPIGSLGTCGRPQTPGDDRIVRCIADAECADGLKCVPMSFRGEPYGSYCLLTAPENDLCPSPYPQKKPATSVDGTSATFCFPVETLATCEAIIGFKTACDVNADCGRPGMDDSLCQIYEGDKRCTYACSADADCRAVTCAPYQSGDFCNPF